MKNCTEDYIHVDFISQQGSFDLAQTANSISSAEKGLKDFRSK